MRAKFIRGIDPRKSLDIGTKRGLIRDFDEMLKGYGFVEDTPEDWPKSDEYIIAKG